ncbi:hypothetical protein THIOSC13_770007 [uncultured Thiomicrorhabdus sp.]
MIAQFGIDVCLGLRVSEVVELPFEQLNLNAGMVQVTGKGAKERIVPIGEEAAYWLERYLQGARAGLLAKSRVDVICFTLRSADDSPDIMAPSA